MALDCHDLCRMNFRRGCTWWAVAQLLVGGRLRVRRPSAGARADGGRLLRGLRLRLRHDRHLRCCQLLRDARLLVQALLGGGVWLRLACMRIAVLRPVMSAIASWKCMGRQISVGCRTRAGTSRLTRL